MTFASTALGQLRYISESVLGVTPVAGNGVNLRITEPTMKAAISSSKSNEISSNRMVSSSSNTDMNVDGGFNFELSGKEYDPFLESVLYNPFVHYGAGGLGATFSMTTTANTVVAAVAPAGASAFANLSAGSWFKIVPPAGASQAVKDYFADLWLKVSGNPTADTITVDASTPIAAPGLIGAPTAGYAISQSVVVNGETPRSFTLEWDQSDIGQFLFYKGMQGNTLSLSVDVGAIITGSFGFTGMSHGIGAASVLPGVPVESQALDVMNAVTDVGLVMENGANLLSGGSFIQSVKLDINNNHRAQKAIATYGNAGIGSGEMAVSGSLEVYFEDATYYNKWLNGTNTSLAIGLADQFGNGYLFEMDKVRFKDGGLNPGGRDSDVMLSLPFDAFYNAATGRGLRVTRAIAA